MNIYSKQEPQVIPSLNVHNQEQLENENSDYSNVIEKLLRDDTNFNIKLLEQLIAGVFITYDYHFVYVNPYFANMLGYAPHELIGKAVENYLEEEDWHIIYPYDLYSSEMVGYEPIYRWNGVHRNGSKVYLEGRSNELSKNQSTYRLVTVQDVTVKYDKERDLIENAKIFSRVLMAIPEPVFITIDSEVVFANRHGLDLIGKGHTSSLVNKKFYEYFNEEDRSKVLASFNVALKSEDATPFKAIEMNVNDRAIEFELSCVKIDNYIGQRAILTVMRDLTDRKENEERIIRSEKLSVIGQLAAGVAHEIRNPLTALKGFTQLLKNRYEDHSSYFEIMANEIDRINLIVNEFMTLAKPHFSSFQHSDINNILTSVLNILETQATLLNIQVAYSIPDDVPKVYCNENQLKQVFMNLIKNAFEAMPTGGKVIINVKCDMDLEVISVIIQDYGGGMPESVRKRIGEPFLTTKEKGTGLGLMVSSRIIEDHNGVMNISSEEGVGTIIDVQIPFDKPSTSN